MCARLSNRSWGKRRGFVCLREVVRVSDHTSDGDNLLIRVACASTDELFRHMVEYLL